MVGFQGFGNVGDEAILCGIESLLGDRVDVEAIFSGGRQRIAAFPSAARIRTWHHLPTITAWRVLRRSRALAISGGGLINDHWATVIPRYVGWCLAARLAGCRVVWVGSGVGPIRRTVWQIVAGLGFRASRLVTVRDAASADWVRRCAPGTRVAQIPDPAFFMDRPAPASAARPSGQVSGRLAIVARGPIRDDEDASLRLAEALADVVVGRADAGKPVSVLLFHDEEDGPFLATLATAVAARDGVMPDVIRADPDPAGAMRLLAGFDELLTVRLHGLILGALVGLPAVTVGYDAKVSAVAAQLGLDDLLVPLDAATGTTLLAALARSVSMPGRGEALEARVQTVRGRHHAVADLLVRAMTT